GRKSKGSRTAHGGTPAHSLQLLLGCDTPLGCPATAPRVFAFAKHAHGSPWRRSYTGPMPLAILENAALRPFNTFGVEARARFFVRVASTDDLAELDTHPLLSGARRLIVGGGSNLLFASDFDGVVVKVDLRGVHHSGETNDAWLVEVGAGENWHATV